MCQPGAVVGDNDGLASTNPQRGCSGITASSHQTYTYGLVVLCTPYNPAIPTRYTISLELELLISHCMELCDKTEVSNESPLLVEGGWNRR